MYKILLNQTFLFLEQHPGEKFTQLKISEEVGLTPKTVRKQLKEIIEWQAKYPEGLQIKNFYNDVPNRYERAIAIVLDLEGRILTLEEMCAALGSNSTTINKFYSGTRKPFNPYGEKTKMGVYGIFTGDACIYIGFSANIEQRIKQHKAMIDNKDRQNIKLYNYCSEQGYTLKNLSFVPLATGTDTAEMKRLEGELIRLFDPIGNNNFDYGK